MKKHDGIKELTGREPVACAITVGIKKGGNGYPIEKDRFHIVLPREADGVRAPHPAFAAFNTAPPDKRKVLRGVIMHATREECFEYHLRAQVLDKGHPDKRPACQGDGVLATRWMGGDADNFQEIKCPGPLCEYRINAGTKPVKCKPFARLLFRLSWPDGNPLDTPLAKYSTGAWSTTANLLGFFDYIEKTARQLGLKEYSLFGMPFVLTLQDQTKASTRTRFPVVTFSPSIDPASFFLAQRQNIAQLQSEKIVALPDLQAPGEVFEDVSNISVPSK